MNEKIRGARETLLWAIAVALMAFLPGAGCGIKSQPLPPEVPATSGQPSEIEPGNLEPADEPDTSRELERAPSHLDEEPDVFE